MGCSTKVLCSQQCVNRFYRILVLVVILFVVAFYHINLSELTFADAIQRVGGIRMQRTTDLSSSESTDRTKTAQTESTITATLATPTKWTAVSGDPTEEPLILLYNEWGREPNWNGDMAKYGNTSLLYQPNCSHRCKFTLNREKYEYTADMVIVSVTHSIQGETPNVTAILRTQNNTGQLWVAAMVESAHYVGNKSWILDNVFHWMGSHRVESDIRWPYGRFYALNTSNNFQLTPEVRNSLTKRKLVTWLVSHCYTQSDRRSLVKTLRKYVPVHIYGRCYGRRCPETKRETCRSFLGRSYKFYLAFENSLCLDYVTEKFFTSFKFNMVPVTYGWANYSNIAPPHSFINALDFKSIKELAEYLLYLDGHDEEYLKYFKWKENYDVIIHKNPDALCRVCGKYLNYRSSVREKEQRLTRQPSYLKWYSTFPSTLRGWNNSDVFTVAGTPIISKSVCISPKRFTKWLRGK